MANDGGYKTLSERDIDINKFLQMVNRPSNIRPLQSSSPGSYNPQTMQIKPMPRGGFNFGAMVMDPASIAAQLGSGAAIDPNRAPVGMRPPLVVNPIIPAGSSIDPGRLPSNIMPTNGPLFPVSNSVSSYPNRDEITQLALRRMLYGG